MGLMWTGGREEWLLESVYKVLPLGEQTCTIHSGLQIVFLF